MKTLSRFECFVFGFTLACLLFCGQAWAGEKTIFDTEYTKYPRATYEKYCAHHKTPGGYWDCLEALDEFGVPALDCFAPTYLWVHEGGIETMLSRGWLVAPLNFDEDIINEPFAPRIYWFYKCED